MAPPRRVKKPIYKKGLYVEVCLGWYLYCTCLCKCFELVIAMLYV